MFVFIVLCLTSFANSEKFSDSKHSQTVVYRQLVKAINQKFISNINQKSESFHLKANQFLHFTSEQFKQYFGSSFKQSSDIPKDKLPQLGAILPSFNLSLAQIDWRTKNKVSSVKNQNFCSTCYAFAAIADIQTSFLFRGLQLDLSEQQIVDCTYNNGNNGCVNGHYYYSLNYAQNNFISLQAGYPYSGKVQQCKQVNSGYKISSLYGYNGNSCPILKSMLSLRPVIVSVDGTNFYWQFYGGGVLSQCGKNNMVNHAVQVVGIQSFQNGSSWWIAKNSWGVNWGENGFIRLDQKIQSGNICLICSYIYHSIL